MPAPAVARAKVTFGGVVGPTPWATSIWFSRDSDLTPAPTNLDDALTAFSLSLAGGDLLSAWKVLNYSTTILNSIRIDAYAPSSNASVASASQSFATGVGTGSATAAASQCVVATLLTGTQTKSGRGRMYWPATAFMAAANAYTFPTGVCSTLAAGLADWIGFVNGGDAFGDLGVLTAVVSSSGGLKPVVRPPAVHPVTSVRVDNLPDRQEHREKNIVPSRSVAPV